MPHQHHLSTTSVTSELDDYPLVPNELDPRPPLSRHNSAPSHLMLSPAKCPFPRSDTKDPQATNRISAPGAIQGFDFGGVLGYEERDLESEAEARARGVHFGGNFNMELQKRRDRDVKLKRQIRRFRFVVRCMQLGCRYRSPLHFLFSRTRC